MTLLLRGDRPYTPLPFSFWVLFGLLAVWTIGFGWYALTRYRDGQQTGMTAPLPEVTAEDAPPAGRGGGGLFAVFYTDGGLGESLHSENVPGGLSFHTGHDWAALVQDGRLGGRLSGWLEVPRQGTYSFSLNVKDGVRIWINNQLLFEDWDIEANQHDIGTMDLPAGEVPVYIEWHTEGPFGWLGVVWSGPETAPEFIPAEVLRPDPRVERPGL